MSLYDSATVATTLPPFRMTFELMTIEHLGLRLYSKLPPVISEMVSNAYDAESPKVEIVLPSGAITDMSEVVVRDYGHGMTPEELAAEYLPIGRNRRERGETGALSKNRKVKVTGRKGLGKLSAFGVANEMEVRAVKGGEAVCLRFNYTEMSKWAKEHPGKAYEPTVVTARTGTTSDDKGVEVRLRGLHRKTPVDADQLRRGLARRLMMIGTKFEVSVNGTAIGPGDRVQKSQCVKGYSWDVTQLPKGGSLSNGAKVTGWVGFIEESSQTNRGVDIFANNKAVELESFFNNPSTHAQFARAHLVGEIHADFLDATEDLASTARNSVVWESDAGAALESWGREVLQWAFEQWVQLRKAEKETTVVKGAGFDKWLESRKPREQKVAQRMLRILVDDPNIDPSSTPHLLDIVKESVESVAFRELVEEIEEKGGANAGTLLRLFQEWRVIEARKHLDLADGRVAAITQLDRYMVEGALEVQELQPLFERSPWLIDTSWTEADRQATYTRLLRERYAEPAKVKGVDRRLDLFGVRKSVRAAVIELKHPKKKLTREDLNQIEEYVDWLRSQAGTGPDSPRYVDGLLIVGEIDKAKGLADKIARLQGSDIRVETYVDLRQRALEYYGLQEKVLVKVAPEFKSARGKKKK
jgi:hypothetical protein